MKGKKEEECSSGGKSSIIRKMERNGYSGEIMKKILMISSTGGHLSELLQLLPLAEEYQTLWVT